MDNRFSGFGVVIGLFGSSQKARGALADVRRVLIGEA